MTARTHTPDRKTINAEGRTVTTIKVKRACNGCSQYLGDITEQEMTRAIAGLSAPDVRAECDHCRPLVALERAGCRTWQLTPLSYVTVDRETDRDGVFAKAYTRMVDGKVTPVGIRIGVRPDHTVAFFGDWVIRHPDGRWSVHKAPAEAQQQECALCGHLTCMGGKPCGVVATEREDLPGSCGCTGAETKQPVEELPQ